MAKTSRARKPARTTAKVAAHRPRKSNLNPKAGPVNEWMELRRSPIQGVGAFARKDIPTGTRIIEYQGEKITNAESDRRYPEEDRSKRHHTFLFILNTKQVVDAAYDGNAAMFINHSCDPNCETFIERGHIWIDAMRDIRKGEELTYDYMYDTDRSYTDDDLFRYYGCACGSKKCRKTIVMTKRRPKT
jgi:SET domain-containing protein